jgi:predicted esterase
MPAPHEPPIMTLPTLDVPVHLDEAQLNGLREAVRRQAKAVNIKELLRLPQAGAPFSPLFKEPVPTSALLDRQPSGPNAFGSAGISETNGSTATAREISEPALPPSPAMATFNPYPGGPEPSIPAPEVGYHAKISVLSPGRLDWTFVSSYQSLDPEPTSLTPNYDSTEQSYELYVPPNYDRRRLYPMMIFVSPGGRSDAWAIWRGVCERHGVILAGPHDAGNNVPMVKRCRVVLDVLDDVRRRFHIDPDRTYISGTSGGGAAAARIVFALPELFGGLAGICGAWNLRPEPMLRRRVRERLSVAIITGDRDFNGPELQREFYPILVAHEARARLWVFPMGHAVPGPMQLDEIFQWLEAGLAERRALALALPNSRFTQALRPEQWATATLLEAAARLRPPDGTTSGLFLLQGVAERWKGLPAAAMAEAALKEFDAGAGTPWQQIYRAERLRFRYLQCQKFDGIVNSSLPADYPVPRRNLVEIALMLWKEVRDLAPKHSPIAQEAQARLAALREEK